MCASWRDHPARQPGGNEFPLRSANHKAHQFPYRARRVACHVAFQIPGLGYSLGDTSVELTSLFWTAGVHVAFTDDPARATVRVQITEDADAADFAVVDDGLGSESESCQANPSTRLISIAAQPVDGGQVIYLSSEGPADYRVYVRSKTFSQREAAALIVGARGGHRHLQAASL
jgi:hypothetical protein